MKKFRSILMVLCLAAVVQPVSAGVEAECRQEAEDYGVMPELRDDYINGCIDSRGGASEVKESNMPPSESDDESNMPPSESDDASNPVADSENVAE